ncbi:hypothetical protein Hypma_013329 [Hypsizygus marmoreus]|uniref:Aminoglycoside phosphotransferase domain-containing protein n=1 Tax=Hypsizygus marmoreus TaxID=39966 RepID=A0A369JEA4_HYPMA|nr:hypothetical protein Hypma_013329 [Hypsizygus marmoreus]
MDKSHSLIYIPVNAPSVYNPMHTNSIDFAPLKQAVHRLLGLRVLEVTHLGRGYFNTVHELKVDKGPPLVARINYNFKTDPKSKEWAISRLTREMHVIELVRRVSPSVPIPRILAQDLDPENSISAPFTIMERMYGEDQWKAWPTWSQPEKVKFISSLAEATVGIFQVSLPSIGTVDRLDEDGRPIVIPFFYHPSGTRTPAPCSNIDDYVTLRLDLATKLPSTQPLPDFSVPDLLLRLRSLAKRLIPHDNPTLLQPILVHNDLDVRNIMVKDGTVSAVIDWEMHAVLPAYLAASYPPFIRYDGIYDPKYDIVNRKMPTRESWATIDEGPALRAAFREAAGKLSSDFIRALDRGDKLRQLLEFVSFLGDGVRNFVACYEWERETTAALDFP